MIELSIKRPLIVFVMFAIIALTGLITYFQLNINLIPKFETNVVTITTIYPGAAASEVESSVTKKIEDAISSLENIDKIKSVSAEGYQYTTIELKSGADVNISLQDAQRKINAVVSDLPEDVKVPTLTKISTDEMPVMNIASFSNLKPTEFYKLMEDKIQPHLSKLEGVGAIKLIGGTKREIKVAIDQNKIKTYNLSILQVQSAIQKANMDFPTGRVEDGNTRYTVRLSAKYINLEQLKNTLVTITNDGSKVFVKDIAEVTDGIEEITSESRLNGESTIGIQITKQSDANAVKVCSLVREELKKIKEEYKRQGVDFDIATDTSVYTMDSVNAVVEDLALAVIIVSLVCFIFLHSPRSAMIVMVAVPLSMMPAFTFLYLFGYSLNVMSLMALSLAVGILVDDSIVVVENIFRHLEMGKNKLQAALDGSKQIFFTATSITLVIVSVFLPLSLSGGIIGNILKEFSLPIIVSTMASLLVSFSLTPLLLSKFAKISNFNKKSFSHKFSEKFEEIFEKVKIKYSLLLEWSINNRKKVYIAVFSLFIGSFLLLTQGFVGASFIPETDQSEFVLTIEMPPQITVYENNLISQKIERLLLSNKDVLKVITSVGQSTNMLSTSTKNNIAQITVKIVEKKERTLSIKEFAEKTKHEILETIPGIKVRSAPTTLWGSATTAAIEFSVKGTDLRLLDSTAAIVMDIMKKTAGTVDVKFSIDDPKPEISVQINRSKMEELGLSVADVGATLRTALSGNTDSKFKENAYEYDINIQFDSFDRQNIDNVASITFINKFGQLIELKQFADIYQTMGPSMLERTDRMNSYTVSCNVLGRSSGTVGNEIQKAFIGKIPNAISVNPSGMLQKQNESFSSLLFAFIAAIVLVYLIMVALYNSLLYPFVVLFSIPMAMIGSLLALALAMETLNILTIIGLITLLGLVAKNAILLVDFTNELLHEGKELKDALIEAGKERIRPILMTTFAMVFGMLPLAIASGAGSELKNGMALVIIGGLISSLILTLVVVPCVFYTFETIKRKLAKKNIKENNLILENN
ncbi:MAG TPA: efflux RND transporter permease subunit [Melioribacteraceae bacterium]|nr:efflux RND transporter permease subunit [Melioribacteraceae bacterium]